MCIDFSFPRTLFLTSLPHLSHSYVREQNPDVKAQLVKMRTIITSVPIIARTLLEGLWEVVQQLVSFQEAAAVLEM